MSNDQHQGAALPAALTQLSAKRPRNLSWLGAGSLLFGDWGTSRLYVLGIAFVFAGRSSLVLVTAMSVLIMLVAWAYTHICRIYPDGGGVYTAGKERARVLGVIGALLLFADYTVTASLSSVDAFHYFGLGAHNTVAIQHVDPGSDLRITHEDDSQQAEPLFSMSSPGLWAIVAILALGAFNLLGPRHSAGFATVAAIAMVGITLLLVLFALPQIKWHELDWGTWRHKPADLWYAFVQIVLALSGVEAIANLTAVMKKPVFVTAKRSIYLVAAEVAIFNILLTVAMIALGPDRHAHKEDMLAFMAGQYTGVWGERVVRIVGGLLLISACNTAVNGLLSITYVMSRDGELPEIFQRLNRFGAPWFGTLIAAVVPSAVLLFAHDIGTLSALYAIGVVGAVAINCSLCTIHPRLRSYWRKAAMGALGLLLLAIWVSLAWTKHEAVLFVVIVLTIGLGARQVNKWFNRRGGPKPSLLRQAINEQLTPEALGAPKMLVGTYGADSLAIPAMEAARASGSTLVVCFIREVALGYGTNQSSLTIDTDPAALRVFARYLEVGHMNSVKVLPIYDTGPDAAVLMAENAAIWGCHTLFIGSSRQGAFYTLIKGRFQQKLESLLPPDIKVEVLSPSGAHSPRQAVTTSPSH
jgi:amino acid transporter